MVRGNVGGHDDQADNGTWVIGGLKCFIGLKYSLACNHDSASCQLARIFSCDDCRDARLRAPASRARDARTFCSHR